MPRFAANLTMMYNEHPFLDRFAAAAKDGFQGVEFLFPYAYEAREIRARLEANGLAQALFNAPPGDWEKGERGLASTLRGRTTFDMSVEVPRSQRIGFAKLQPADVIFFGDNGPKSQPSHVGHMGIYVGNGWFIHSSEYGVALAQLDGWYANEFAWARRPLAEAGLTSQ